MLFIIKMISVKGFLFLLISNKGGEIFEINNWAEYIGIIYSVASTIKKNILVDH